MKKANKIINTLKYSNKKSYRIAASAIFVIIISHFLFQFFYIQSENIKGVEELVRTEQFEQIKTTFAQENLPNLNEQQMENTATEMVDSSNNETLPEVKFQSEVKKNTKVAEKPRTKTSTVKTKKTKNTKSPKNITKNVPQSETRAERLRRAEKLLTGV